MLARDQILQSSLITSIKVCCVAVGAVIKQAFHLPKSVIHKGAPSVVGKPAIQAFANRSDQGALPKYDTTLL